MNRKPINPAVIPDFVGVTDELGKCVSGFAASVKKWSDELAAGMGGLAEGMTTVAASFSEAIDMARRGIGPVNKALAMFDDYKFGDAAGVIHRQGRHGRLKGKPLRCYTHPRPNDDHDQYCVHLVERYGFTPVDVRHRREHVVWFTPNAFVRRSFAPSARTGLFLTPGFGAVRMIVLDDIDRANVSVEVQTHATGFVSSVPRVLDMPAPLVWVQLDAPRIMEVGHAAGQARPGNAGNFFAVPPDSNLGRACLQVMAADMPFGVWFDMLPDTGFTLPPTEVARAHEMGLYVPEVYE